MAPRGGGALDQFTIDLTAQARAGQDRPGPRARHRNPPGHRYPDAAAAEQPDPDRRGRRRQDRGGRRLRAAHRRGRRAAGAEERHVRTLDLGLLQAGAGVKGEFENRLKRRDRRGEGQPKPIILFIDEAHTLIGAGGAAGQNDAANLLKPALARGELRTIAATTWAEYKKYFEKDAALTRRFQVVKVEEPTRTDGRSRWCAGWSARWRSTTTSASWTRRSARRCGCRPATSRAGSCRTRRSA